MFATTANTAGSWSIVYFTFTDWAQADAAPLYYLDNSPPGLRGYHAAPQVFYFAPQSKWYLIFQSGQPQYSTNDDVGKPEAWTQPVNFFASDPPGYTANRGMGFWLDFFVICDDVNCHLFFTDDDGELFRSQTTVANFPMGFGDATVAIQGVKETVFEGSTHYRIKGKNAYLTIVEAFGPTGNRFFRSFVSSSLDGVWTPLADNWSNPFAGKTNVTFADGVMWTNDISHGELIRDGYDQKLEIDPANLKFLYQGADPAHNRHRVLSDPVAARPAHPNPIVPTMRRPLCVATFGCFVALAGCADDPSYEMGQPDGGGGGDAQVNNPVPPRPASSRQACGGLAEWTSRIPLSPASPGQGPGSRPVSPGRR